MAGDDDGLRAETRERVWSDLREVARPDSRFGWDFSSFIADYEGAEACAERIIDLAKARGYQNWFVTPDNNLDHLRAHLVERDTPFIMPTYGIRRGFLYLDSAAIDDSDAEFAGTLDGMNRFANRMPLGIMEQELSPFDCMVTGASFVTADGLRMGKGHGFFDLEWAMMREIGLADEPTDVVAVVHETQVLDDVEGRDVAADHDTVVDYIVHPSDVLEMGETPAKPEGLHWAMLDREEVQRMPPLETLWERAGEPDLGNGG